MHAAEGCTVGTSMTIGERINPAFVGSDIGCGMQIFKLADTSVDFWKLDECIREKIPSGAKIYDRSVPGVKSVPLDDLHCCDFLRHEIVLKSFGTLGGGNHFIELNRAENGSYWLLVHSGSRNIGKQVAEYYQNLAETSLKDRIEAEKLDLIESLKLQGRQSEIQTELAKIKEYVPNGLEYLYGGNARDYLHDMAICQLWANENRRVIAEDIIKGMNWGYVDRIESIHNYIDIENGIVRKGAISAQKDETCLIPLNMRDGTLICVGKGNEDWNYSAPHGAGRLMSRGRAKKEIKLRDFEETMKDVYSSTVCQATIDESPFAYKDMEEIMKAVEPTVDIVERIIPVYNYKATE
jgi:RNA-splicing ligase RtcB